MVFEIYRPGKNKIKAADVKKMVRVSFYPGQKTNKKNSYNAHIVIGSELCDQIGLKVGQKVTLLVCSDNPKDWLIKTSLGSTDGYTLQAAPGGLKLVIKWNKFIPSEEDRNLRKVNHEFYDGGLRLKNRTSCATIV